LRVIPHYRPRRDILRVIVVRGKKWWNWCKSGTYPTEEVTRYDPKE
jgi:hypothetical protein